MFTILVTEQQKRGLKGWCSRTRPRLEEQRTLEVPWRLIRAPVGKNGPDWSRIEALAGRHRTRLLCGDAVQIPADREAQAAELFGFQRIMAAKAICHMLKGEETPPTVGVIDPTGRCLSAVEILLEQAGCVLVYTDRPQRYEWFARTMLEKKGAPVVLCQTPRMMSACRAVLLGGRLPDWQQWVPSGCVAFSAVGQPEGEGQGALYGFEPQWPHRFAAQIPPGVPAGVLCAGLYELAARCELAELQPLRCMLAGQRMGVDEAAKICFDAFG